VNRIIPIVLSVALFMENMDSTVIATSLPAIAADIGTSPIALKLALTSYYVALAICIPASGYLADRVGPRRLFQWALVVFMAGSVACAEARSLEGFVAARFLQGMGGAMMTPIARLVLVRSIPKAEFVGAMAWFTIPALVGPLIGPPVGGAITTFATWHWIFYINVPIGLAGIVLTARYLPDLPRLPRAGFDARGFALAAAACAGLVFGSSVVSLPVLPPWVGLLLMAAGSAAAAGYLAHARGRENPILRLSLMAIPSFRASIVSGFLFRLGIGAVPFLLPLLLQLGFGFTPFESGLVTCVTIFGAIGMKLLARSLLRRFGFRRVLIVVAAMGGVLEAPLGLWRPEVPLALFLLLLLAGGFVRSLFFTGINALAFADIPPERSGDAAAFVSVGQQVAIALGVALAGGILEACLALAGRDLPVPADFTVAFLIVGALTSCSAFAFLPLGREAGAEVSGHRGREADRLEPAE
jgi:EmrB/QacA subfamily drug resistance transporter